MEQVSELFVCLPILDVSVPQLADGVQDRILQCISTQVLANDMEQVIDLPEILCKVLVELEDAAAEHDPMEQESCEKQRPSKFPNQLAFLPSVCWCRTRSWLLPLISFALSLLLALESRCALCWAIPKRSQAAVALAHRATHCPR